MKLKSKLITILFALLFVSYTSTKTPQTPLPNDVAPNSCRINGTVVNIENITETSGPCALSPCVAKIKINNVIKTGSSFRTPLIKGDTIKIKFEFTLSETSKELFPTLEKSYPGLQVRDKFIGDIERIELIQLNNSKEKFEYKITDYVKE